ncbi:MAG TPA: nitrous oxide reductase accessory protein NosL [Vicinamibacterales bacterium]|nr:nitrous oxide reductase accessory protein NosL [Vicinamibacterales bacterium]
MKVAAVFITMVWAVACAARAGTPPAIVMDRSACAKCGMLISEGAYAAAIRFPDGHDQVFDDIGCLVAAVRQTSVQGAQYWFHDAASGEWITGASPVFVVSSELRTPMGGGIAAFLQEATAQREAIRVHGRVVRDIPSLIALEGNPQ